MPSTGARHASERLRADKALVLLGLAGGATGAPYPQLLEYARLSDEDLQEVRAVFFSVFDSVLAFFSAQYDYVLENSGIISLLSTVFRCDP